MNQRFKYVFIIITIGVFYYGYLFINEENIENNSQSEWDKINLIEIDENDESLRKTIQLTRKSLDYFQTLYDNDEDKKFDFFVKIKLSEKENSEHIWIEIVELNKEETIGLIGNDPVYLRKLKYLDTVKFNIENAEDLMILKKDSLVFGGFLQSELEGK